MKREAPSELHDSYNDGKERPAKVRRRESSCSKREHKQSNPQQLLSPASPDFDGRNPDNLERQAAIPPSLTNATTELADEIYQWIPALPVIGEFDPMSQLGHTESSPPSRPHNWTLQDYQMHMMSLDRQKKKRLIMGRKIQGKGLPKRTVKDYQMQMMVLEQQNKRKLMLFRQEQENAALWATIKAQQHRVKKYVTTVGKSKINSFDEISCLL
ncbi:hypothetical protein BGW36DRAFT_431182 [Talaromyces proteolyticus]|uniref:Uncharacterized protein n=1 Tax=Talaromyces proteolyticus TaxID=1131652 RepID=A0AAD4KGZ9_9EURO|nr:uncharacterized protein BGW36DRAFT_431182 [Talaromyces proteolyticus]KAH8691939.1 hypothetical protein BGW36DRAFT_431182 [Talaromyces proteolyticus]